MIGLDTNVLLRLMVDDKSPQVTTARKFAATAVKSGELLYVGDIVLIETLQVLDSVYAYPKASCVAVIESLLSNAAYSLDRHDVVEAAWTKYRDTGADFSDCLIAAKNAAAGCTCTATFDRAMRALPAIRML